MRGLPIIQFLIALMIVGLQGWGLMALLGEPAKADKKSANILQSPLTPCILTVFATSPPASLELRHQGRSILKLDSSSTYPHEEELDLSILAGELEMKILASWENVDNATAIKLEVEPLRKPAKTGQFWSNKGKLHDRILLKW